MVVPGRLSPFFRHRPRGEPRPVILERNQGALLDGESGGTLDRVFRLFVGTPIGQAEAEQVVRVHQSSRGSRRKQCREV